MNDNEKFFEYFIDHVLPKLRTYEACLYLYLIRKTLFVNSRESILSVISIARECKAGKGNTGGSMGIDNVRVLLKDLDKHGLISIVDTHGKGTVIRCFWPWDVEAFAVIDEPQSDKTQFEEIDFYNKEGKAIIMNRDGHKCSYCNKALNDDNSVLEHVISRPSGTNSYYNLVAACRSCNNKKNDMPYDDFLRTLYRESLISEIEFKKNLEYINSVLIKMVKTP